MTGGCAGTRRRSTIQQWPPSVIARPPPLAEASRCDGERSLPPRAHRAPRSATAARRSHRPGRPATRGEAARSRAIRDRMGSSRAGPAAATPPPMTTRLTPRVRASDRIARARWSATRSVISVARASPAALARKTSAALGWGGRMVLRPAAIASSAWRPMAGPAAIVSRQPRRPQAQTAPSGSATTWPTSPAKPLSPRSSGAVEHDAGRDAGPDRQEGDARRRLG